MCEDPVWGDVHLPKNIWLTLSSNEKRSEAEANEMEEVAQILWCMAKHDAGGQMGRTVWSLARVLLEHITHLGQVHRKNRFLGSLSQLQLWWQLGASAAPARKGRGKPH